MTTTQKKLTVAEFLALPEGDITYELVEGQAVPKDKPMSPKRFHARVQPVLWRIIEDWCTAPNCPKPGSAYTEWAVVLQHQGETWIPVPDIIYISEQRLPLADMTDEPCLVIPELVVEVLSPSQTFGDMAQKAVDYLEAGVNRVWIVDPAAKTITVFYPDRPPRTFRDTQSLSDELLPGLTVIPQEVFAQARIP
ncbi:MAG: Uma2 family endonuclease [Gloeomargarita sp. SKYBB_i_bin120]|nr:Uma2 family endonuclease [Gloeomargarita sp. SKYB120]MDW8178690.1 Uma2 family endonuclease [Gloeomargarita sp. SKYBB_i_bin120]